MKCLILAAGRFGETAKAEIVAERQPRLDVFELARVLEADVLDFNAVDESRAPSVLLAKRTLGNSAALAVLGYDRRHEYDAYFTSGEDIGLPLAALLRTSRARCSHTMIAHTLFPRKKRVFFTAGAVIPRIDCMFVYSTTEEQVALKELHMPASRVRRINYHADEHFFRPDERAVEPDLVCAAGQLLRDYDCLVEAVRELPVRVQIAAGSPWIDAALRPRAALPPNVVWGKLDRFGLRDLYARSALAVVPILQNHYQTGIATILEMMAMGKCIVVSRTHGQTDTIEHGVTGFYVPPSDPRALRDMIQRLLANREEVARVGAAARRYVEERAGLDLFVQKVAAEARAAHEARLAS
jgi:glycosyltransferase involved in cell wall biosynthesis